MKLNRQQKAYIANAMYIYIMGQTSAAAAVTRNAGEEHNVRSTESLEQRMKNVIKHIRCTITICEELLEHGDTARFMKELAEHSDPVARDGILLIINHDVEELTAVGLMKSMFQFA